MKFWKRSISKPTISTKKEPGPPAYDDSRVEKTSIPSEKSSKSVLAATQNSTGRGSSSTQVIHVESGYVWSVPNEPPDISTRVFDALVVNERLIMRDEERKFRNSMRKDLYRRCVVTGVEMALESSGLLGSET